VLVDQYGCFGLSGDRAAIGTLVHHPETKNPACFSGEQGSRKSMIYGEIDLPAGLLGKVFVGVIDAVGKDQCACRGNTPGTVNA